MKISEVINELKKIQNMEGDVEVQIDTPVGYVEAFPMSFEYDNEEGVCIISVTI